MSKRFQEFFNRKGIYVADWAVEAYWKLVGDDNLSWY